MDATTLAFSDISERCQDGSIEELVDKHVRVTCGYLCRLFPVCVIKQLDTDTNNYKQDVVVYFQYNSKVNNQFINVPMNSEITIKGTLAPLEKSLWNNAHIFITLVDCSLEA